MSKRRITDLSDAEKQRALDLHEKSLVIDNMVDAFNNIQTLDAVKSVVNVAAMQLEPERPPLEPIIKNMADWYSKFEQFKDKLLFVTSIDHMLRAKNDGKLGILLHTNSADWIGDDLNILKVFYKLGLRSTQLTYNWRNLIGDGCAEASNARLSDFGINVVEELNRLGILINLSHAGHSTSKHTMEISKVPVAFTHSNARGLCDNVRNISDDLIHMCAEKGGVIGVIAYPSFVSKRSKCSIEDFLDHIDYFVNMAGIDHVGIGTDINEGFPKEKFEANFQKTLQWLSSRWPDVYLPWPGHYCPDSILKFPQIIQGLVVRGYSDQEITKILGGNWFKLYQKIWLG